MLSEEEVHSKKHTYDIEQIFFCNCEKIINEDIVYVGFSGGVDSTVLLDLLVKYSKKNNITVVPCYCDHNMQEESKMWGIHCEAVSKRYNLKFLHYRLNVTASSNIENAARSARHQVWQQNIKVGTLALAHHQDDQVETVLFRIIRGTGISGASGMQMSSSLGGIQLIRPLLNVSKDMILAYAKNYDLSWVEDLSNKDSKFDRNFIRNEVLPLIKQRWPQVNKTISRFGSICSLYKHEAEVVYKKLFETYYNGSENHLDIVVFENLTMPQSMEFVQYVLTRLNMYPLTEKQLRTVFTEIVLSESTHAPEFKNKKVVIKKYRHNIYFLSVNFDEKKAFLGQEHNLNLNQEYFFEYSEIFKKVLVTGEAKNCCSFQLKYCPLGEKGKKIFQQNNIPPWERQNYPGIFQKDKLIAILGIWKDPLSEYSIEYATNN